MNKENYIIDYFCANYAYNLFLMGLFCNDPRYINEILDKKYISGAMVGAISTIFLSTKENIVDKGGNFLINEKELEKNVSLIALKDENGYYINNYHFVNEYELVVTLRNKLAHGEYLLDLNHDRIILKVNGSDLVVNIQKLARFVISSLSSSIKNYNQNELKRSFVCTNLINGKDKEKYNVKDYESFIKSYKLNEITIKRKDGKNIEGYISKKLENVWAEYKEKKDKKILVNFEKEISDYYTLSWTEKNVSKIIDVNSLAVFLSNSIQPNIPYKIALGITGYEVERLCNPEKFSKFNLVNSNTRNLIILESIKNTDSVNKDIIFKYVYNKYGQMMLNYDNLSSSLINSFNALFSYGFDDVYKNDFEYKNYPSNGFDYSLLDFSKFNIEIEKNYDNFLNDLVMRKDAINKELIKLNNSLVSCQNNLNIVKSKGIKDAENKINLTINTINSKIISLNNDLGSVNNDLFNATMYINNNVDLIKKEKLIEGIRNSIAHGNYKINLDNSINNSLIIFEDIYEDKLNFKISVTIYDFYLFLHESSLKIDNFLNSKINNNALKI